MREYICLLGSRRFSDAVAKVLFRVVAGNEKQQGRGGFEEQNQELKLDALSVTVASGFKALSHGPSSGRGRWRL